LREWVQLKMVMKLEIIETRSEFDLSNALGIDRNEAGGAVFLFVSEETPVLGEFLPEDDDHILIEVPREELNCLVIGPTLEDIEMPPQLSPMEIELQELRQTQAENERLIAELSEKLDCQAKIEMSKDREITGMSRKIEILEQDVRKIKAEKAEQVEGVKALTRDLTNREKAYDQMTQDKTQLETLFLKEKDFRKRAEKDRSDLEIKNQRLN
jgi:hypothetical protein